MVISDEVGGRRYFFSFSVVCDVEHGGDEEFVASNTFTEELFSFCGRIFEYESAFGSEGNDDGIFDLLCFCESEDFCSEVVASV